MKQEISGKNETGKFWKNITQKRFRKKTEKFWKKMKQKFYMKSETGKF